MLGFGVSCGGGGGGGVNEVTKVTTTQVVVADVQNNTNDKVTYSGNLFVNDAAVVIPSEKQLSVSANLDSFVFTDGDYPAGRILMGNGEIPYLRKVVSSSRNVDGSIYVETKLAGLNEVLKEGSSLSFSVSGNGFNAKNSKASKQKGLRKVSFKEDGALEVSWAIMDIKFLETGAVDTLESTFFGIPVALLDAGDKSLFEKIVDIKKERYENDTDDLRGGISLNAVGVFKLEDASPTEKGIDGMFVFNGALAKYAVTGFFNVQKKLDYEISLDLTCSKSFNLIDLNRKLITLPLAQILVGPVWVTPEVELRFLLKANLDFQGSYRYTNAGTYYIKTIMSCDERYDDGWKERGPNRSYHEKRDVDNSQSLDFGGTFSIAAGPEFRLNCLFYGTVAPYVYVAPQFDGGIALKTSTSDQTSLEAYLDFVINGGFGFNGTTFSVEWMDWQYSLAEKKWNLYTYPLINCPQSPKNIVATAGSGKVFLTWDADQYADGYILYISRGGETKKIKLKENYYSHENLINGVAYSYQIQSYKGLYNSAALPAISATPVAGVVAPSTPTGLSATAGDSQVSLIWTAVSGATGYKVYRGGTLVGSPTAASYTDTGLSNGTSYSYAVSAVNSAGENAVSSAVSATPATPVAVVVPSTPTGLSATVGDAQVALGWTAVSGATGYKVYRGGTLVGSPTAASYTDTGLSNGTSYSYTVSAVNSAGESAVSSAVSATPVAPDTSAPTGSISGVASSYTVGDGVSFSVSGADNKVLQGLSFVVKNSGSTVVHLQDWVVSGTSASQTGTFGTSTLAAGTYTCTLTITDANSNTGTVTASFTLNAGVAADTTAPTGTISGISATYTNGDTVSYTVTGADAVGLYRLHLTVLTSDGQTVKHDMVWDVSGTTASQTGSFSTTGWSSGTYNYALYVKDAAFNQKGYEGSLSVSAAVVAPSAPTNLSATAGDAQVALAWTAVSGATGYKVYRSGSLVASPTTNSHTDTGLTNSTVYSYTVSAVNAVGESAVSAAVSATPVATIVIPSTPSAPVVAASADSLSIAFTAVTGATSYNLYKATSAGVTKTNSTKIFSATSPYSDTFVSYGTTYYYCATAVNAAGESELSPEGSGKPIGTTATGRTYSLSAGNTNVGSSSFTGTPAILSLVGEATGESNRQYRFRVSKIDGTAFSTAGTVKLQVGSYESYGEVYDSISIAAGNTQSGWLYVEDLNTKPSGTFPKEMFVRYVNTDGGVAWVGPLTISMGTSGATGGGTTGSGTYVIIDVSGGASATSYPVSYTSSLPTLSDEYKTSKIVLRWIPAGSFTMGSPEGELGRDSDETQHSVTLTSGFYMGVFEVTQAQYQAVMGSNPSSYSGNTRPVESVSWTTVRGGTWAGFSGGSPDSNSFIGKLRSKAGLSGFDLPTEAQWEYACRAGTTTALNSGVNLTSTTQDAAMDAVGRYLTDGGGGYILRHTAVGSYTANSWGLYDMHGNVWEWCLDWYVEQFSTVAVTDPKGSSSEDSRVLRSGDWSAHAKYCRSASRSSGSGSSQFIGFRLYLPDNTPTGLTATVGGGQVALAWTAVDGATSYNIFSGGSLLTSVSTNSYIDTGLSNTANYIYTVSSVNTFGESAVSAAAVVIPTFALSRRSFPESIRLSDIVWSGSKFIVAGGVYNGFLAYSTDGVTWDIVNSASNMQGIQSVATSDSTIIALAGSYINSSKDESTWMSKYFRSGYSSYFGHLYDIAYGSNIFCIVGGSGRILTSEDGESWTERTSEQDKLYYGSARDNYAVSWSGNSFWRMQRYYEQNYYRTLFASSIDGITWKDMSKIKDDGTYGLYRYIKAVAHGNKLTCAVGKDGVIAVMADGDAVWRNCYSGTTNNLNSVAWNGYRFCAVGDDGTIVSSPDGISWWKCPSDTSDDLASVTSNGNIFLAVSGSGNILISE